MLVKKTLHLFLTTPSFGCALTMSIHIYRSLFLNWRRPKAFSKDDRERRMKGIEVPCSKT